MTDIRRSADLAAMGGVAGVVLAGGKGSRLGGVSKAGLVVGGKRLLDRASAALAGCVPLLVAHGQIAPASLELQPGQVPVADPSGDYAGPLAGVAGAIAYLAQQQAQPAYLLSVAVDTPFLPADFIARLMAATGDGPGALPAYAGQVYPTDGLWRLADVLDLPHRVAAGTAPHSLKRLALELGLVVVEWPESPAGDPFANINTPAELAAMQAIYRD